MKSHSYKTLDFKESIFATMSQMANLHQAINLSQGFPDFDGEEWIKELAHQAIKDGHNQYPPFAGVLKTRESISDYYHRFYKLNFNPQSEITVTSGATEAIFVTILALVNPGDEVIVFEPFYDSYCAAIKLAGGIPVPVTLKMPEFNFVTDDLGQAISEKTKLIIFNNPHNPTGKVFTQNELERIAQFAREHDLYVLSDEVYEFLTYDGIKHIPMATLEGMKERTITISSMGKTFGMTGWKVGWTAASPPITHSIRMVHQFNVFSVATPFQMALAKALNQLENYLDGFKKSYQGKRDYFFQALQTAKFNPIFPQGTYFIMCQFDQFDQIDQIDQVKRVNNSPGIISSDSTDSPDLKFCRDLIVHRKVAAIPASPFYCNSKEGEKLIRFCFAKKQETLVSAFHYLTK